MATTTGIRQYGRENGCYVSVQHARRRRRRDADRVRVQRRPLAGRVRLDKAAREAADRATRLLGATKPPRRRLTVVLDPYVTAQFLGVISGTLNGEAVAKGRSLFQDRLGRSGRQPGPSRSSTTRPTRRPTPPPTSTARDSRRGATCSSTAACCTQFVHSSYSARRAGTRQHRQRGARRVQGHARRRVPRAAAASRARVTRPS